MSQLHLPTESNRIESRRISDLTIAERRHANTHKQQAQKTRQRKEGEERQEEGKAKIAETIH